MTRTGVGDDLGAVPLRRRARSVAVLATAAVLVLAGCAPGDAGVPGPHGVTDLGEVELPDIDLSAGDVDVPEFRGPWAAEFADMYRRAQTDLERTILEDGVISDQEVAETRDKFRTCLTDYGFVDIVVEEGGGFSAKPPADLDGEAADERVSTCSVESGEQTVLALQSWTRRNPENLDESTIMAACLVNAGVVDVAYTAEDFARDVPTQSFPYLAGVDGLTAFGECNTDPLGLFR